MSEQKNKTRIESFNIKQQNAFANFLVSAKGLSYKDAEQVLYELLNELKTKALIKS